MQDLNPLTLPLNKVSLIEASAGTGKTHTIASLYLRLLLKVGKNSFERPLKVDEILVVTFTKMATEELRGRIRERIHALKLALEQVNATGDHCLFQHDDFLHQLIGEILKDSTLDIAITTLTLAEQDFDLSAIFTIHSFCQRMLTRYAFNSGLPFDIEIKETGTGDELKARMVKETWREYFYPASRKVAEFVQAQFVSPDKLLSLLNAYIGKDLAVNFTHLKQLTMPFSEYLTALGNDEKDFAVQQQVFKEKWQAYAGELQALFAEKGEGVKRYTDGKSYAKYFQEMLNWANSPIQTCSPKCLEKYFTSSALAENMKKGVTPFSHILLDLAETYDVEERAYREKCEHHKALLTYHFLNAATKKILAHKACQKEQSFDDLLTSMENALRGVTGGDFAHLIRSQYPFAMIDEFQDTDSQQYFIFSQIYLPPAPTTPCGFLMIGDPKQSIYKFRGADIFSYLNASLQAEQRFTLAKNWRSNAGLIDCVNALFQFPETSHTPAFLYPQIQFAPVQAGKATEDFLLQGKKEPAMRIFLTTGIDNASPTNEDFARVCALSIRQWLEKENHANVAGKPIKAKNIAVLVRKKEQADLVQLALREQGIHSVYLSEKKNVFQSDIAEDLLFFLQACLNPLNEKNVLNAVSRHLFFLNMAEIDALKQSETLWEAQVNNFLTYQRIWRQQGVLAMLHHFLQHAPSVQQGLQQTNGERNLTDFLHLAELLQKASRLNDSQSALLRWYEKQLNHSPNTDGTALRLESDRDLVKIVTIHKSKGLAYDLVWLPFLDTAVKHPHHTITTYYDENAKKVMWDMQKAHQDCVLQEALAEEMRLLYVALTRAKYQVAIALPEVFKKNGKNTQAWQALWFALTQGQLSPTSKNEQAVLPLLEQWQNRVGKTHLHICSAEDLSTYAPLCEQVNEQHLSCATFHGNIEQDWQVSSFSQIQRQQFFSPPHQGEQYSLSHSDENAHSPLSFLSREDAIYPPLAFPKGQRFGIALHNFLEEIDFQTFDPTQPANAPQLCHLAKTMGLTLGKENLEVSHLAQWINALLHTPLLANSPLCLKDIANKDRLNELEFFFRLSEQVDEKALNQLLATYHHLPSVALVQPILKGLMHGFIDLVFRHQGKYYIVDYKSHFLGTDLADYSNEKLKAKIQEDHYDWQYLIYCVALHRHLKNRLPTYQYEQDFGGVMYLFLRGMTGKAGSGVYFDKPEKALIDALEKLFIC